MLIGFQLCVHTSDSLVLSGSLGYRSLYSMLALPETLSLSGLARLFSLVRWLALHQRDRDSARPFVGRMHGHSSLSP